MERLFKPADITVSDYQSERASGYRYLVPVNGKKHEVVMITEFEEVSVPYFYIFEGCPDVKEAEQAYALVIEYECGKGNEWAQKMKDTAINLWDMIKANNGEAMYPLADRSVCIAPCLYDYDKEIKDAIPSDIEYYLAYDEVVDGGNTIFNVCRSIVNYEQELELRKKSIEDLRRFFEKNCREAWDKPYGTRTEEEREALGTFSDWHKDIYGYRPRNNENNRCINKEQRDEEYER